MILSIHMLVSSWFFSLRGWFGLVIKTSACQPNGAQFKSNFNPHPVSMILCHYSSVFARFSLTFFQICPTFNLIFSKNSIRWSCMHLNYNNKFSNNNYNNKLEIIIITIITDRDDNVSDSIINLLFQSVRLIYIKKMCTYILYIYQNK